MGFWLEISSLVLPAAPNTQHLAHHINIIQLHHFTRQQ